MKRNYWFVLCVLVTGLILQWGCRGPEKQASDSRELLKAGWDHYRLGEFDQAISAFEQARALCESNSLPYCQTLYGLATTWNLRRPNEDPELAAQLYEQIISECPDKDLTAWSLLALARMKHLVPVGTEPDYDDVRAAYRKVIEKAPGHPAAEEAVIYLNSTYVVTTQPDDAEKALQGLNTFIEQNPDSGFISAAYALAAECHNTLQQADKEFTAKEKAFQNREVDTSNPFYDNSWRYWNIAASAEFEAGDFETARVYYRKLIDEYPQDIRVYASQQAIKRMDRIEAELLQQLKGGAL